MDATAEDIIPYVNDLLLNKKGEVIEWNLEICSHSLLSFTASAIIDEIPLAWLFECTIHPQSRDLLEILFLQPIFGTLNLAEQHNNYLQKTILSHEKVLVEYSSLLNDTFAVKDLRRK